MKGVHFKRWLPENLIFWLTVGGGASFAAVRRPAAVRFQPSTSEGERQAERSGDDTPEPPLQPSNSRDFPNAQPPVPAARPGSLAASLPLGNRRASVVAGNLLKQLQVKFGTAFSWTSEEANLFKTLDTLL